MPRRKKRGGSLGKKRAKKGKSAKAATPAKKKAATPSPSTSSAAMPSTPTPLMKTTTTIIETTTTKKTTTTTTPVANKSPAKKAKAVAKRATALTVAEIPHNLIQQLKNPDVQEKVIKFLETTKASERDPQSPAMAPMEASLAAATGLDEDADNDNNEEDGEDEDEDDDGVADLPSPPGVPN